jgi:ATP-dependent Lon protease
VEHYVDEAISPTDAESIKQFAQLKALSKELVSLLSMSTSRKAGLPPMVARRLEILIAKKDMHEAGSLGDFMVSAVETTFPERLEFLAAVTVPHRITKAVVILTRQVENIKSTLPKRSLLPPQLIVMESRRNPAVPRGRGRRALAGMGSGDDEDADTEENEVEELAKTLKEAGLSSEAEKIAKRELQRLKRMSPVQAEYGVCRTYLETLAEVSRIIVHDFLAALVDNKIDSLDKNNR